MPRGRMHLNIAPLTCLLWDFGTSSDVNHGIRFRVIVRARVDDLINGYIYR